MLQEKSHWGIKEREVEMKEFLELFFVLSLSVSSRTAETQKKLFFLSW